MNWYLVYSGGLHALAALCVMLLLAPGVKKPQATYTIDFIGTGAVQVTAPKVASKPVVQPPAPAQEAIAKPEPAPAPTKKEYVSKTEIAPTAQKTKKKPAPAPAPLEAPSVLDEEPVSQPTAKEEDFGGGSITTDFANFPEPWYITQVRNSLWSEWEKRRPAGNTLTAQVTFAISWDGSVKNVRVEQSSHDDTFDFAATSAVLNAAPFPPLPKSIVDEKDSLTVTVDFRQTT